MTDATARSARVMVRAALKAALATADASSHTPYASMILLATTLEGEPLTLISSLARHTRNLGQTAFASILVDTSNAAGDATTGGRISLMGRFTEDKSQASRARFLARHPAASGYADFADFTFYRMTIESAHFIEGFGRIVPLPGPTLYARIDDPAGFAAAEPGFLANLRQRWPFVTGFDAEGVDLIVNGHGERVPFDRPATDAAIAHAAASICLAAAPFH